MTRYSASEKSQKGAAAIEAALLFVIFFAMFYAIVSYSIPLLLVQSFNHAASSGARSALAVEPTVFEDSNTYIENGVKPRVREIVGNSLTWLPSTARTIVLGEANGNVRVEFDDGIGLLTVTVIYAGYNQSPMVPTIRLPGIGDIPRLPANLQGVASVSL